MPGRGLTQVPKDDSDFEDPAPGQGPLKHRHTDTDTHKHTHTKTLAQGRTDTDTHTHICTQTHTLQRGTRVRGRDAHRHLPHWCLCAYAVLL